jgi:hypothetical protein
VFNSLAVSPASLCVRISCACILSIEMSYVFTPVMNGEISLLKTRTKYSCMCQLFCPLGVSSRNVFIISVD